MPGWIGPEWCKVDPLPWPGVQGRLMGLVERDGAAAGWFFGSDQGGERW
ncbi:hypothetical protein G4L39_10685 [Limisphaera ngatamarikiensis]|uniref:Uncharacterized protein n=1 Tax=Limisphaera ngatamarikiensis TaxID=1324935 RepID=A0A6M1RT77_9BACT|nr:hypothetical protein [Limisphaera ngatamarikiensis]NGO39855.1 hypothetical protein [Limisphaera ngatamarikiensis]